MGCGSSSIPSTEKEGVPALKVVQYAVNMTYDDDSDNDFDSVVPSTKHRQDIRSVHMDAEKAHTTQSQEQESKNQDKLTNNKISTQSNVDVRMTTPRLGIVCVAHDEPDSDDDSDYYESAGEDDSDDEDLEAAQERLLNSSFSSLHSMMSSKLKSRSGDDSSPTEEVEACGDTLKQNFRGLLQCDSFSKSRSNDTNELDENSHRLQKANNLKQSVRQLMIFNAFDGNKSRELSPEKAMQGGGIDSPFSFRNGQNSWSRGPDVFINNMMSFRSISDLGSDSRSADDEEAVMELSLNALLTFRSTALVLREKAKKFRAELRGMNFDSHPTCKYTTTYIRYKMNKIIGLNSALSKFSNDNAFNILNPFADKDALTTSFNSHLHGLLKCIRKTKLDRINVTGPLSRSACAGLVAIYELIAELSPSIPEIPAISNSIRLKVSQYDAKDISGSEISSP